MRWPQGAGQAQGLSGERWGTGGKRKEPLGLQAFLQPSAGILPQPFWNVGQPPWSFHHRQPLCTSYAHVPDPQSRGPLRFEL